MVRVHNRFPKARRSSQGMSMIELMIALTVMVVGMAAMLVLIMTAIMNNNRAKQDTGGTMAAQLVMETITAQQQDAIVPIADCAGNVLPVSTTGTVAGVGAQLNANGNIDFAAQTNAAVPANYKMQYRSCGPAGTQTIYDVRWNVRTLDQFSKLVTVSARPIAAQNAGANASLFAPPVTLKSIAVRGN